MLFILCGSIISMLSEMVIGLSTLASPILGSNHFNKKSFLLAGLIDRLYSQSFCKSILAQMRESLSKDFRVNGTKIIKMIFQKMFLFNNCL